jgi:hypothetical protein
LLARKDPVVHPNTSSTSVHGNFSATVMRHILPPTFTDDLSSFDLVASLQHMTIDALQTSVTLQELNILLESVDLAHSPSVISFTSGNSGLRSSDLVNNVLFFPCDVRTQKSFTRLRQQHGCHVLIASPRSSVADAIITNILPYARHMACFRLPLSYFTDAPFLRSLWMSSRFHNRQLDVVPIPLDITPDPHIWLRAFPSAEAQALLLRGNAWDIAVQEMSAYFGSD